MRSRRSCVAFGTSASSLNSMYDCERPSHEFERMRLMPEIVLTAFSIGFVMSFSIASGDAPG